MIQDVFLVGLGNVGRELVMQMFGKGDMDGKKHQNPSRIVGVTNSKYFVYKPEGLNFDEIRRFYLKDCWRRPLTQENIFNDVKEERHEQLVFVDATASSEMLEFYEKVIDETPHCIVTANKKPLVECDFEKFKKFTREAERFGYRCSVMAGAGGVYWVRKNVDLNDPIEEMNGILSGTIAFTCNELMKGRKLVDIIEEAIKRGYAEPDFRDDLNGMDAARKLIILVRSSGVNAGIGDVLRKGFVSDDVLVGSPEKMLRNLKKLEKEYSRMAESVKCRGEVLSYIAGYNKGYLSVGTQVIDGKNPLAQVEGTQNRLMIKTKDGFGYDSGLVKGAGLEQTARNIRWDLNDLLPERRIAY